MEDRHEQIEAGAALVEESNSTAVDESRVDTVEDSVDIAASQPPIDPGPRRSLWANYRNARLWGKTVRWSLRYARQARSRHE